MAVAVAAFFFSLQHSTQGAVPGGGGAAPAGHRQPDALQSASQAMACPLATQDRRQRAACTSTGATSTCRWARWWPRRDDSQRPAPTASSMPGSPPPHLGCLPGCMLYCAVRRATVGALMQNIKTSPAAARCAKCKTLAQKKKKGSAKQRHLSGFSFAAACVGRALSLVRSPTTAGLSFASRRRH